MSIEKLIEENTAAIKALTEALTNFVPMPVVVEAENKVPAADANKPVKKSTAATASSQKDAKPDASEKKDNASEKPAGSKEETEALYEKIKQPFLDLVASNRADAVALLADIGAKQLKTADFDQLTKAAKILGVEELS